MRLAALGLLLLALTSTTGAQQTPDNSDTVLRAAYCVGAIKQQIEDLQPEPQQFDCPANWATWKFQSQQDCTSQFLAVLAAIVIGGKDAAEKKSPASGVLTKCSDLGEKRIDCIAKYDQVYANTLRCQNADWYHFD